jgi:outer membrane protein assembly factor BamB
VTWWPQPRQSSCAGGSASNTLAPSVDNVADLEPAWTYGADVGVVHPIVYRGPVMRSPYVYAVVGPRSEPRLHAIDLASGEVRWKAKWRVAGVPPVADSGMVLLGGGFTRLRRYVPRSGHIVWQRRVASGNTALSPQPVVSDGNWYQFGGELVVAYDARTGRLRWRRWFGCFNCDLAAAGGRVYVAGVADNPEPFDNGTAPGRLYALDAGTGKTLWSAGTDAEYTTGGSPILAADRVFVRTMSGPEGRRSFSIEAFRASDGEHLWHAPVGVSSGFWFTPPAASSALVVYPSEDGFLYALDAATGERRWRARLGFSGTRPAIVNGLVWAGDDERRLVALDARNGRELWRSAPFSLGRAGTPAQTGAIEPVVAGAYVLVATEGDGLRAYHVPSG